MKTTTSKTPDLPKEFDLNGSINAHFSFIKKKGNRIAYLRTEKSSGITSIEVIEPVKRQHPLTGETYYAYPSPNSLEPTDHILASVMKQSETNLWSFILTTDSPQENNSFFRDYTSDLFSII